MIKIDSRLLTCAGLVTGQRAVDVGTDHAYLAVYLVRNNICQSCIACDINDKPLMSAKANIMAHKLSSQITAVKSDGLDNVPMENVTDVIMAGMGGELISSLINKCPQLSHINAPVNLVLQPMTKSEHLRKWLYMNNFIVKRELACRSGGFVYSVIQAEFFGRKPDYPCDERYIYTGRISKDEPYGREYIENQINRMKSAALGMLRSHDKRREGEYLLSAAESLSEYCAR
ncbi:MAG: tRNA (adenine(22)-N(1))-methyltransferase [Oscillospiraceae bacterium]